MPSFHTDWTMSLAFLNVAFTDKEAGAAAAGGDAAALQSSFAPTPEELSLLAQAHEEAQ